MLLRLVLLLSILLPGMRAQEHVVQPEDLSRALRSSAAARGRDQAVLERFFASDQARKALSAAKLDPAKVQSAIPFLTDAELSRLAARAEGAETFAGQGVSLTNQQVTYIIIGVIAIAIIAIVASR